MAEVVFENVCKSYDDNEVIKDMNLSVADREFMVLVGPSGCGKSTALRMIAGLENITGGELKIGGARMNDVPPKDRDIAMVFQNYALYPHMSVYDNMAFGLKMRKTPKDQIDRKVRDVAKILDLEGLLQRKPKQLSGGQRQRVALGRAIVRDPKVFLMDEPLSNLDAKLRVHMRTEIARLHQRLDATTIYVTHDQVEAMTMGDRIVVLKGGLIQQVDTPMAVYDKPANLFVAGFIGQMNFLTGVLHGADVELGDGTTVRLPDRMAVAAKSHDGRGVVLGIRPEHFAPAEHEPSPVVFEASPDRIELMGSEKLAHFTVSGEPVVAKLPPDYPVKTGDAVKLAVAIDHASLFDAADETRIA